MSRTDSTASAPPHILWPGGAPGAVGTGPLDVPTLTLYPAGGTNRPTILVFPGGGYGGLADHEGEPVAQWLNTLGVNGIVLRYRFGPRYRHPAPLQDAARAVRTARAKAAEWNLDPQKVGVLGFSAGGHLASTISTQFEDARPGASDSPERFSSRPDVAVLLYPVITLLDPLAHAGSRVNLLGESATPKLVESMCSERLVSSRTPPTFLFHTVNDQAVPVENSLLYAAALRRAGVPFEMHAYENGAHGVGLAQQDPALKTWPALCATWLAGRGFAG